MEAVVMGAKLGMVDVLVPVGVDRAPVFAGSLDKGPEVADMTCAAEVAVEVLGERVAADWQVFH
jgi:hypothetical protein